MSFTDTLKSLLGGVVPVVANAIIPGSGGFAKSLIGQVLGVDPSDDVALIDAVKNATPEQLVALKTAEMDHKLELARISASLDIAHLKGTEDARKRATNLQMAGYHNYRADIMITVAFGAFCLLCWLVNSNTTIKPEVLAIFNMSIGALLKMLSDAFQFEFGSSRGSKEKDLK